MKLSIVTTLYKSGAYVEEFHRRASEAARRITDDYEIVMVDDGSPDNSLDIACELARADSRVRVVELSRNFGHHKAMMTGLDHARGELCFLIDSDLEEDPAAPGQVLRHNGVKRLRRCLRIRGKPQRRHPKEEGWYGRVAFYQPALIHRRSAQPLYCPADAPRICRSASLAPRKQYSDRRSLGHHRLSPDRGSHLQRASQRDQLFVFAALREPIEWDNLFQHRSSQTHGRVWHDRVIRIFWVWSFCHPE